MYLTQSMRLPKQFKTSLNAPSLEAAAIDSLTLWDYHEMCSQKFPQVRTTSFYNPVAIDLGSVIFCSLGNQLEDSVEICFLPKLHSNLDLPRWDMPHWPSQYDKDGWTRYYWSGHRG
jgi:hypothetical protein